MARTIEPRETIRPTILSLRVWPALVAVGLLAGGWLHGYRDLETVEHFRLGLGVGMVLLVVVRQLVSPYLVLGKTYLDVRGPLSLSHGSGSGWPSSEAGSAEPETGSLVRLKDIVRVEKRGHVLRLVHWHRAKKTRISLWGLRRRDRERILAYLEEKVGPFTRGGS